MLSLAYIYILALHVISLLMNGSSPLCQYVCFCSSLTADRVFLSEISRIKQMIGRLLEGRQHENALLHLGQTEAGDAQNLTLRPERRSDLTHSHDSIARHHYNAFITSQSPSAAEAHSPYRT